MVIASVPNNCMLVRGVYGPVEGQNIQPFHQMAASKLQHTTVKDLIKVMFVLSRQSYSHSYFCGHDSCSDLGLSLSLSLSILYSIHGYTY